MNHGLSRGFRCGVLPRQTQTNNDASGSPQRVAGRPLTSQTAFGGQLPYKGSLVRPAAIFGHSRSEYNGKFLRTTNNEPRATIFSRAEGHSRRCRHSESVAAKRHLSPRRPANCDRRGRQALIIAIGSGMAVFLCLSAGVLLGFFSDGCRLCFQKFPGFP